MDITTVEQVPDYRIVYRGPQRKIEYLISWGGYGDEQVETCNECVLLSLSRTTGSLFQLIVDLLPWLSPLTC